eukprot:5736115-Prymnesium_polylepis.2
MPGANRSRHNPVGCNRLQGTPGSANTDADAVGEAQAVRESPRTHATVSVTEAATATNLTAGVVVQLVVLCAVHV